MSTARPPKTTEELVAIIGLGCVMPDANNVKEFWRNIETGHNSIREVPRERWDAALFYDPDPAKPDKTYAKIGAFVTTFKFNSLQFKIPPSVAKQLDETQKWALAAVAEAFADAGYDKKPFDRTRCAVILGNAMGGEVRNDTGLRVHVPRILASLQESPAFRAIPVAEQQRILRETETAAKSHLPEITEDTMPGELSNVIAGRIANVFDLSGKNFTTDAACASSLAAIDAAVKGLQAGDYDLVLTGGADRSMDVATYVKFCKIGALSAKGSFPFDARADGFVMGEGCGILLLKRLNDAIRDGDKIHAILRGAGSSSDAKGKGITAPNIEGQLSCLTRAFLDARVEPSTIGMVECHGTSTKVGDVVEIQGLTKIFGGPGGRKVPIGSIKSQVGHLKSAAGAASLIKMILAVQNKVLPPSIHFETPNPNIPWSQTPFYVNNKAAPWPDPPAGTPRRAAISSFGFGGTNFNVILEEYAPGTYPLKSAVTATTRTTPVSDVLLRREPRHRTLEPLAKAGLTELLVVGAATADVLEAQVRSIIDLVQSGRVQTRNFPSFAAQTTRDGVGKPVRLCLVVENLGELPDRLHQGLGALREPKKRMLLAPKGIYVGEGTMRGKMAMVFPGQGSQYADMLRDLSTRFETVKRTLEQIDDVMTPFLGKPITEFIFPDPAKGVTREAAEEALKQTAVTQPAMLTADLALYRLLADYGVQPDMVAGHSLGEYAALVAAGVMTLEDACIAVSARGREMANIHVPDLGKMASVTSDPATVERLLKQVDGYVIPANKNCRVQTVIAGASKAVDAAVQMFNQAGIQAQHIAVSAAFHSQIVAPAKEPLRRVFEKLDIREPKIALLSNVTADYYPHGPEARTTIIDLLSQQVAAAVEWQKQTERMYADGARVFVEVGPKTVLTTFTKNTLEGREFIAVGTNHPKRGGFYHLIDALAVLAAWGYPLRVPDPLSAEVSLPAFREAVEPFATATALAQVATAATTASAPDPRLQLIQQLSNQLQQMQTQVAAMAAGASPGAGDSALRQRVEQLGLNLDRIVISGASVGLPGSQKRLFDDENFERILRGENLIDKINDADQRRQLDKNIVRLVKSEKGDHHFEAIKDVTEVIRLAGRRGGFDLVQDYGINPDFANALDVTSELAIAAGIEALRDAGIPLVRGFVKTSTGKYLPGEWVLPEPLQHETGVIFASAFPGFNRLIEAVSQFFAAKHQGTSLDELADIYAELIQTVRDPEVRRRLTDWYTKHFQSAHRTQGVQGVYEFNRKFLFHVLSMGHAQLAQLIKAKGPNTQVNAACSSTTQAVGIAEDWIRTGRCKRVLVVGADDITSDTSLEWFASGFLAAGAATTKDKVEEAALPFDRRRHGMIIGMGAVGLVVEADEEVRSRGMEPIVEVVASHIANSAYHGSRLDTEHVATEMDRLMTIAEKRLGLKRDQIAPKMLFMSHETYTPARGGSAAAEIEALRKTFGPHANRVVVSNTKGFTGHPMGASIEDAIALKSLQRGRVPPIANLKEPDPALGDLNLSRGGPYNVEYALRLAAGFGSQIAFLLFRLRSKDEKRIVDPSAYQSWLTRMSGIPKPELEVQNRALRIKSTMTQPLAVAKAQPEPPKPVAPTLPAAPRPTSPAPRPVAPPPVPVPAAAVSLATLRQRIVDVIADKTGYPKDMLEPDLDLEADLGIDTVKQAELFGFVREEYQLPRDESLQLKDLPTIAKIATYIHTRLAGAVAATAATTPAAAILAAVPSLATGAAVVPIGSSASRDQVLERLLALVADKTGYPKEMLDPNLDLEADLGIDTVKQAEVFGLLRESYQLPRDDNLQLKELPSLSKIADYILARVGAGAPASTPVPAPTPAPGAPAPAARTTTPDANELQQRIIAVIAEKTGYPTDMLDPNLDLEADLGIDTVKQAELFGVIRESYQLPREENLQLKDYPTIAKIAGYIQSRMGGAPPTHLAATPEPAPASAPAPKPTSTPIARAPAPTASVGAADRNEIVTRIRALIAEKTGYPLELLEENLDLEADLGIDTVKQAELFGFVRDTYGIPRLENVQLSNYSTIGKVAEFVLENVGRPAPTPPAPTPEPATAPTPVATPVRADRTTKRFIVHYTRLPDAGRPTLTLQGKTLVVWAAPAYRADLLHELSSNGATGVPLDALPVGWDAARATIDSIRRAHPRLHGLVFVPQPSPEGSDFPDESLHDAKALFYLLKAVLSTGKSGEFEFFATATTMGGDFGTSLSTPFNPLEGALVGIAKALRREIANAQSKALDFPAKTSGATLASTLVRELLVRDEWVEVGTLGGRGTLKLSEEPLSEEEPGVELGPDDVVVVSGGGSGITSDVVLGLGERSKAKFLLLGRTQLPDQVAELARKSPQELAALKPRIAEGLKAKGERATPVQIEKEFSKVQKAVEIHQTLQRLEALGCRALYRVCDVTDPKSLDRVISEARRTLGPVTGILHAAGIEESKLIVDKTPESFNRVFDVKVLGLRNLLGAARSDPLRFVVSFASIAGRVGNAGQADYSAANDVLAKVSLALRQERGVKFPAVTIDWSAWAEKGMATRGSVMAVLNEAGVTPIPVREGVAALADELAHGMRDAEILVSAELGRMADAKLFSPRQGNGHEPSAPASSRGGDAAAKMQPQRSAQATLVLESPKGAQAPALLDGIVAQDERSVVARMVLDPARDPYLKDHAVDGVPYLPGVFGVEAFAEASALLAHGQSFIGARDVEYHLPVKVHRSQPVEVTIHASIASQARDHTEIGCRLQSVFMNAKGERMGAPRIHFTGTMLFGDRTNVPEEPTPAGAAEPIGAADIYRRYFHGPSFQVLDTLHPDALNQRVMGVYAWPEAPLFGRSHSAFLTNPMGRELAFQTAGGYDLFVLEALALPKGVRRIRFHDTPRPGERVLAIARHKETHENVSRYDVKLIGDKGRVLEELQDFELIRIKALGADPKSPEAATLYRARWGQDFPVPLQGARAVLVRQTELFSAKVTAEETLTSGERADQERYRNEKRAAEFFAGRLAAKEAIAILTDRPVNEARGIEVRRLETGEPSPRGKGTENVLVSITHTGDVALAVAARRDGILTVGIDAERIEAKPSAFVNEAFAPEEQKLLKRLVQAGKDEAESTVLFWAVKEAVLKALGKGFALDIQDVRVEALDPEGTARVKLEEPARWCLGELGAHHVHVKTWVRDGHAYALGWTTR